MPLLGSGQGALPYLREAVAVETAQFGAGDASLAPGGGHPAAGQSQYLLPPLPGPLVPGATQS